MYLPTKSRALKYHGSNSRSAVRFMTATDPADAEDVPKFSKIIPLAFSASTCCAPTSVMSFPCLFPYCLTMHFETQRPAPLKANPVICGLTRAGCECGSRILAKRNWPACLVRAYWHNIKKFFLGRILFQVDIQKCANKMLVNRHDAIFAPSRLIKIIAYGKIFQRGYWRDDDFRFSKIQDTPSLKSTISS